MSIKKFGNRNSFAGSLPRKCRKAWSPGKPWEWNSRMMRRCLGHKRGLDEVVRAICHRRSMGKCIYPRHPAEVRYLDPSNTPIKHQPWGGFWMSRVWVWAVEAHCFSQRFFAAIFGGLTDLRGLSEGGGFDPDWKVQVSEMAVADFFIRPNFYQMYRFSPSLRRNLHNKRTHGQSPRSPPKNPWVFTSLASGQDESLLRVELDVPADFQTGDAILVECLDFQSHPCGMMAASAMLIPFFFMCIFKKDMERWRCFFSKCIAHPGIFWKPNQFIGSCSVLGALCMTLELCWTYWGRVLGNKSTIHVTFLEESTQSQLLKRCLMDMAF